MSALKKRFLEAVWRFAKEEMWPFIKEEIWPPTKEYIIEFLKLGLEVLKSKLKEMAERRAKERESEANRQAREEEHKAEAAETHEEAEKHRAIAKVWREVAEHWRRENEELKAEIDGIVMNAHNELQAGVARFDLNLKDPNNPQLLLGDRTYSLPALPQGNTESSSMQQAFISRDPEVMNGALVFAGTCVPVEKLIQCLIEGGSLDKFLGEFPTVSREQAVGYLEMGLEID